MRIVYLHLIFICLCHSILFFSFLSLLYFCCLKLCVCLVAKSCPTLQPHGLQHTRLPCPSLSPRVCSNSCPLSQWCYWTISSSAAPFSFGLQSFPISGSFPVSWNFTSGGQSIRICINSSPSDEYLGLVSFRIDWFDLLAFQGTLKSLVHHDGLKVSIIWHSAFF